MLELPKSGTGYGTQVTLPITGLAHPMAVVLNSTGDVFVSDWGDLSGSYGDVVELPKSGTGYGSQTTLPFSGLERPWGMALDSAGDVFLIDNWEESVLELPKTGTGYGPQMTLSTSGLYNPRGLALDSTGDVFVADTPNNRVVEIQRNWVNFESAYLCQPGQNVPAPCSQTKSIPFIVTASGALDTPIVLTGGEPNLDFTLASGSTCTGEVTAGTNCTVNVTFTPTATGVRNGTVEIVDYNGTVIATLPIYGLGVAVPPIAQLSSTLLQFGTIPFGTTETYQLTVTNIGAGTLTVDPSIAGQSFDIAGSTCGGGVASDESCTLQVEFSPVTAGAHNEALTLETNGPTNPTVDLVGDADVVVPPGTPPKAQVSASYLPFGTISFGTTKTLSVMVTNIGGGTLNVAPSIGSYSPPYSKHLQLFDQEQHLRRWIVVG